MSSFPDTPTELHSAVYSKFSSSCTVNMLLCVPVGVDGLSSGQNVGVSYENCFVESWYCSLMPV